MTPANFGPHLTASIGDADLDFDVTTTIRSVVRHDSPSMVEVIVECGGGVGGWVTDGQGMRDVAHVEFVSITGGIALAGWDAPILQENVERLVKWGGEHAVVRVVCAPGKWTTIYGPDGARAHLPRSEAEEVAPARG